MSPLRFRSASRFHSRVGTICKESLNLRLHQPHYSDFIVAERRLQWWSTSSWSLQSTIHESDLWNAKLGSQSATNCCAVQCELSCQDLALHLHCPSVSMPSPYRCVQFTLEFLPLWGVSLNVFMYSSITFSQFSSNRRRCVISCVISVNPYDLRSCCWVLTEMVIVKSMSPAGPILTK